MNIRFKYLLTTALVFAVLMLASCTKLGNLLVKKEGKWNLTREYRKLWINSVFYSETTETNPLSSMNFDKDGSGFSIDKTGALQPFSWKADDDAAKLSVTFTDTTGTYTVVYDVKNEKKKSMALAGTLTVIYQGDTFVEDREFDLKRVE